MKRDIETNLKKWKNQQRRMPLLLRGARQVGKTYVVQKFGKEEFTYFVNLNFEQFPEYKKCFITLDPEKIINSIELVTGVQVRAGQTLIFLDEIQECPEAIMAMRYFKEQMPELHVIGAGSLLEFTLNDPHFRTPVGRVQFMYLRPLSFGEFLEAIGHSQLRTYLHSVSIGDAIEEVVHQKLLSLVREYCSLGGMPAVIAEYIESKNLALCQNIQTAILATFRKDFGKYANRTPHGHLETIFAKAPGLVGQWLKYTTLDADVSPSTLRNALEKLCNAGLITLVYATSGSGIPLVSHMNEKKCKFLFLDIGLVKRACNLDLELLFNKDLSLINDGALAEQFVGQELLAITAPYEENGLFSWMREAKSSSAEIDFLIQVGSGLVPIEVRAGAIGSLRSLKIFMDEKNVKLGVRISEVPFSYKSGILSIPFYLVEELPRLVTTAQ